MGTSKHKLFRDAMRCMKAEAKKWGARARGPFPCGTSGHFYGLIEYNGAERRLVFSGSPKSGPDNQRAWIEQDVRRIINQVENGGPE